MGDLSTIKVEGDAYPSVHDQREIFSSWYIYVPKLPLHCSSMKWYSDMDQACLCSGQGRKMRNDLRAW